MINTDTNLSLKTLTNLLSEFGAVNYIRLEKNESTLCETGSPIPNLKLTSTGVYFEKKEVGTLHFQSETLLSFDQAMQLTKKIAPLFIGDFKVQLKTLGWLDYLKKEYLDKNASWVGIYWNETFIKSNIESTKDHSSDLILGPFIGFVTPHIRIGLQKGLCGRAIRENKTLNIEDVQVSSEYLACSIETKSEIVIPLRDSKGIPFGELDIDSKVHKAFTPDLQKKLELECQKFQSSIFE